MNSSMYSNPSQSSNQPTTAQKILSALSAEKYNLKQEKINQYRCNSPLRDGSNSHSFVLTFDADGEHGAYYDHVTQEGGWIRPLAKQMGIEPSPLRLDVENTKRTYSGIADYAKTHGVDQDVFIAAGWEETTYQQRPALAIKTQTGVRYRFLDGENPTYKSPWEYQRCWYGLKTAPGIAKNTGQPLVICNGEASTVVAQHFGVAACAVTGGEKKTLPSSLLEELKAVYQGPIIVAFDCLDKGGEAAPALADQLRAAGYVVRAVDLGLGKGGDLADFCKLYQETSAKTLAALPDLLPTTPLSEKVQNLQNNVMTRIFTAAEMLAQPPVTWLLDDIIPNDAIGMIWGKEAIGKSFLMLHIALSVAQIGDVLYIAGEGWSGFKERVLAWMTHYQKGTGRIFWRHELLILDDAAVQDFIIHVRGMKISPKLIIIDTIATAMPGGNDNDAKDVSLLTHYFRIISRALGATVVGLHHPTKDGSTYRGSGAFGCNFDFNIECRADDDQMRIVAHKQKDDKKFPDQFIGFLPVDIGAENKMGRVVVPGNMIIQSKDDPLTALQRQIIEVLLNTDSEGGLTTAKLCTELQCPESTLNRALKTLKRLKFLSQAGKGKPYSTTDAGLAAYQQVTTTTTSPDNNRLFFSLLSTSRSTPATASTTPIDSDPNIPAILSNSNDSQSTLKDNPESGYSPFATLSPTPLERGVERELADGSPRVTEDMKKNSVNEQVSQMELYSDSSFHRSFFSTNAIAL